MVGLVPGRPETHRRQRIAADGGIDVAAGVARRERGGEASEGRGVGAPAALVELARRLLDRPARRPERDVDHRLHAGAQRLAHRRVELGPARGRVGRRVGLVEGRLDRAAGLGRQPDPGAGEAHPVDAERRELLGRLADPLRRRLAQLRVVLHHDLDVATGRDGRRRRCAASPLSLVAIGEQHGRQRDRRGAEGEQADEPRAPHGSGE